MTLSARYSAHVGIATPNGGAVFLLFFCQLITACGLLSFDHFNCPLDHLVRQRDAELARGFEIDRQIEFRRLHQSQVGGLRAFQNLIDVFSRAPGYIGEVHPVAH